MSSDATSTTNENIGVVKTTVNTNSISSSNSNANTNTISTINSNTSTKTNNTNINTKTSTNTKTNTNTTTKTVKTTKGQAAAGEPKKLTQNQILAASKNLTKYINKNKKLPNYISIGGYKFSMNEYAYMLSKTIYYKYLKKTTAITIKYNIANPNKPTGVNIKGKLTKKQYYTYSKSLIKHMNNYKKAPNYVTTKLGKIQYQTFIYSLNKVVYYAKTHKGALPSTLSINIKKTHTINKKIPKYTRSSTTTTQPTAPPTSDVSSSSSSSSNTISLANIKDAATRVNAFIDQNDVLPNYVDIGGTKYTMPKFLYLLTSAIANINSGSSNGVKAISVSNPSSPTGASINGKMNKATYLSLAKNVTTFIKNNKQAPNYANSPLGKIQYQTLVSEFSKVLEYVFKNNKLADSITINVKSNAPLNGGGSGSSSSGGSPTTVLNDKNTLSEAQLKAYLVDTKNCQVSSSTIKNLAASIIKGCTSDKEKATAIYNWMAKNIDYSFYYDTKYGAVNTISRKAGNCVDQAHLSIALYRAAGLAARYVHGTCTFSSGSVYGHVWVQVLIDDTWTVSDTTSSRNSLGVVNNWNPYTYSLKSGKVAQINF